MNRIFQGNLIAILMGGFLVWGQIGFCSSNLLRNASFEMQGSDGETALYWEYGNPDEYGEMYGSSSRRNWRSISGDYEGTICGGWVSDNSQSNGMWQSVQIEGGSHYTFGGWFWADDFAENSFTAEAMGISVDFYAGVPDDSPGMMLVEKLFDQVGSAWGYREMAVLAPADAEWVRVRIFANETGDDAALQFDDLFFGETEPYNPGPMSRRTPLVFSEIMYHPADPALEFVELFNTEPFTRDLSGYSLRGDIAFTFPEGTLLGPTSYVVVAGSPTALQSGYGLTGVLGPYSNSLPNSAGSLKLLNELGAVLMETSYEDSWPWPVAADGAGYALVPDEESYGPGDVRSWKAGVYAGGSPGCVEPLENTAYQFVVINEVLTHTDEPLSDYLELYNGGTQAVDLTGCILTDSKTNDVCILPSRTVIDPHGFLTFDTNALGFNLSSYGETVYLKAPGASNMIDEVQFGGLPNGVSFGRWPDGGSMWGALLSRTEGSENTAFAIGDVVINEIMYHPLSGNDQDEYVELYNQGADQVDVGGWRFVQGINYTIPAGTIIPSGGFLVVAKNAAGLIAKYDALTTLNTVGDYGGRLSDSSEHLVLAALDDPLDPLEAWVVMDEVTYRDGGRWGDWSDGGGSSLELKDSRSDNRFAANWSDSDETHKSVWVTNTITRKLANGELASGTHIAQVQMMLLRRGECLVDEVEVIPAGGANIVENSSFESGSSDWHKRGNHVYSSSTTFDATEGAKSERLRASGSGDTKGNGLVGDLSASLDEGDIVTLSAKVRWLRGEPFFYLRLLGGYLSQAIELPVPENLGTPGASNSVSAANIGPAISDVKHAPLLPSSSDAVTITARADDPDGLQMVLVYYRIDPAEYYSVVQMELDGQGLYSAEIPAQDAGDVLAFIVCAIDASTEGEWTFFPDNAPARECLVRFGEPDDRNSIGRYHIVTTDATMDKWRDRPVLSNQLLDSTFISGNRVIYNAGIRYRGSPFLRKMQSWIDDPATATAAYRVEFPDDDAYLDATELDLDWQEGGRDSTYQREHTAYWMARQVGLPAIYQRYVVVYLNGLKRGLVYTDSQHIDQDYVQSWYPDRSGGDLHKINDWIEYDEDLDVTSFANTDASLEDFRVDGERDVERYRWCWERKKTDVYDLNYDPLMTLVDAANLSSNRAEALSAVIDVRQWTKTIALRHVVCDWDSFGYERGKNMFTYRPEKGKWDLLIWDSDFGFFDDTSTDLFKVDSDVMPQMYDLLHHDHMFRRYYWQALEQLACGPMSDPYLEEMIAEMQTALQKNGLDVSGVTELLNWIGSRCAYIQEQMVAVTNLAMTIDGAGPGEFDNMVRLTGYAPIQVHSMTVDGVPCEFTWLSDTRWQVDVVLSNASQTVTVQGYDQEGTPMPEMIDSRACLVSGASERPEDSLVINEIMYHPDLSGIAYVEFYNRASNTVFDLYNYRLQGVDLTFEEQALIEPNDFMVVTSDRQRYIDLYGVSNVPAASWKGSLDNHGETVRLVQLDTDGASLQTVDEVTYDNALPWPVGADGMGCSLQLVDVEEDNRRVGNWQTDDVALSTPNASNSVVDDLPPFVACSLNELQPVNGTTVVDSAGDYDAWFEVHNDESFGLSLSNYYLTDDYTQLDKWAFAKDIFMGAGTFLQVWADGETNENTSTEIHAGFALNSSAGSLALVHKNEGRLIVVDYVDYQNIPRDRSYGDYGDGVWTNRMYFAYPTPGTNNRGTPMPALIVINEWMADNVSVLEDPQEPGKFEDWFELYNAGSVDVDLAGYTLTDDADDPAQWIIPSNTVLRAGGYRLVWADDDTEENLGGLNDLHANFKLSASGDSIGLYNAEGALVDFVEFDAQVTNVSQGCFPDASRPFYSFSYPTPYSRNLLSTNTYTIAASAGPHGSILASGQVTVPHGYDQSFLITPDSYYLVDQVLTNGMAVPAMGGSGMQTFTLYFVTENIQLDATFQAVTASNGTPEWWLVENGLTNDALDVAAIADSDDDGYDALSEFIAGTEPTNQTSFFAISDMASRLQSGAPVLEWSPSVSGRVYTVRGATAAGQAYETITNLHYPASCYTVSTENACGFYQVIVELK